MFVCSMVKYLLFKKKSGPFITYQIDDNKLLLGQQHSVWFGESLGPWSPFGGPRSQIIFMIIILRSI